MAKENLKELRSNVDIVQLISILDRNKPAIEEDTETQYLGEWIRCVVAIGKDRTADIMLPKEEYDFLMSLK